MWLQQKYEVIRLIEQNAGCHMIMDYVQGELLIFYLKNHAYIEKKQVFSWIRQIIKQLECMQRVKGIWGYGYLTPYCIVVKEDKSIALLDLRAESNAAILRKVKLASVQSLFFSQNGCEDDRYALGKTMQFLFAHAEIQPALTKREERKFQKIISKCLSEHSKKSYQNISDILKEFPKREEKKRSRFLIWIFLLLTGIVFAVMAGKTESYASEGIKQTSVLEELVIKNAERMQEKDMREIIANIYIEYGEYEAAIKEYERLCEWKKSQFRYQVLIELYEKTEQEEKAFELCMKVLHEMPDAREIGMQYIWRQCKNTNLEKTVREERIGAILLQCPGLWETKEFQKLQMEYGIKIEGEKVWVEK